MRIDARQLGIALALALLATALANVVEGALIASPALIGLALPPALCGVALLGVPLTRPRAARVVASAAGLMALVGVGVALMAAFVDPSDRPARLRLALGLLAFSLAVLQVRLLARVAPSKPPAAATDSAGAGRADG